MFVREHTPRNARVPTLEASNQVQIDDLVQRNRALEQTNKNFEGQLYSEQRRNKEALAEIQEQLHRERQESREGCDVLISCHRLVNLRTLSDLETVKTRFLQEQEVTRQEKKQRLQRDTQILNFQIREGELEDTIARLKNETEDILAKCGAVIVSLRRNLSTERKTRLAQILVLEKEKDEIQDKLSQLRQDHATLKTSAESSMLMLERVTLQFEGARTKNTELERSIDELKRKNAELQRQLEKWQTLDAKGNGEMDAIRKQKMELEVKLSSLQDRSQRQVAEKERELERMAKRNEKMKDIVQQWQLEAEEEKSAREKMEDALAEARTRIKQLEMESRKREKSDEGHMDSKSGSKRSRSPTQSKKATSSDVNDAGLPSSSRKVARKPKSKLSPVSEVVIDEVRDTPTLAAAPGRPSKERNSKKASKSDKGKAKALSIESETEDDADQRSAPKGKRQRKISDNDEGEVQEVEVELRPAKKARERARGDAADVKVKGRRGARQTDAEDVDSEAEQAPMKKKRKINIFSKPAEPTFAFMGNDTGIGLDIPTILSPVKETTGVPNRSTSASVMNRVISKTFSKR